MLNTNIYLEHTQKHKKKKINKLVKSSIQKSENTKIKIVSCSLFHVFSNTPIFNYMNM